MRIVLLLASIACLVSCNSGDEAPTAVPEAAQSAFTNWTDVASENITVPEGVSYSATNGVARIAGVPLEAPAGGTTGGVGVHLPDSLEAQASGHTIRVTVRASSADEGALMGVAYSTADVGNSGWQAFNLTPEVADYSFVYDVPTMQAGNGDYLGVRSYGDAVVQVVGYSVEIQGATP